MTKHIFSTGLPKLDHFIGNLQPGDSLLMYASDLNFIRPIIDFVGNYANQNNITLLYLSVDDFFFESFKEYKKFKHRKFSKLDGNPASLFRIIKRFTSTNLRNSYLIIDDLAKWIPVLGNQKRVVDLFSYLVKLTQVRNSLLVTTALRYAFEKSNLISLKDASTICLDFIQHQGQLFCVPKSLKMRYGQHSIVPFRFDVSQLARPVQQKSRDDLYEPSISDKASKQIASLLTVFDEKYKKLFHDATEPMFIFDITGDYREVNEQTSKFIGYSSEELKNIHPFSIISPSQRYKLMRLMVDLKRRKSGSISLDLKTRSGKFIPAEIRLSCIGGALFFGIIQDLSSRSKLDLIRQQKEEEYKSLIETFPYTMMVVYENQILFANRNFYTSFLYRTDVEVGKLKFKELLTPDSNRRLQKFIKDRNTDSQLAHIDLQFVMKDDTLFDGRVNISNILFHNKSCQQIIISDVTSQKGAIEKLIASEKRFRTLIENSSNPVAAIRDGKIVYLNRSLSELFDYESNEGMLNKDLTLTVDDSEKESVSSLLHKHITKGLRQSTINYTAVKNNGNKFDCELLLQSPVGSKGTEILGFFQDKSDYNRLTKELQLHNEEMKLLEMVIPTFSTTFDIHKLLSTSLNKIVDTLSWGSGALYLSTDSLKVLKLHHQRYYPDVLVNKLSTINLEEGIGGFISKTLTPQYFNISKYPSYLPHKSLFRDAGVTRLSLMPLVSHDKLVGMFLLVSKKETDGVRYSPELFTILGQNLGNAITNANSFQRIADLERNKNSVIESSPVILYEATPMGDFKSVNAVINNIVGYSPKDFYKNASLWLKLIHPDDKKIFLERISNLDANATSITSEYRVLPKGKAAYRWVSDYLTPFKDSDGKITSVFGTISDITDQKQLIDSLTIDNIFKTNVLESFQDGIIVLDRGLRCLKWNKQFEEITGIPEKEALGKSASEILPNFAEQNLDNLLRHALDGKTVSPEDQSYTIRNSNQKSYFSCKYYPLRRNDGHVEGIVGMLSDISQRKSAENEIREFEHVLSNVIDTMGDILILTDLNGKVLQVNRAFLHLLGYPRKETTGCDFPYPWLLEEEMGRFVLWISELRENNWLHDFDMTIRAKDGRLIAVSLSTTLLRNQMGEPIAMLNIARDITERRRLAKELESRNRQIEMINRIISAANQTLDFYDVFDVLVKEINKIVHCEDINVGLLTSDAQGIMIYATTDSRSLYKDKIINLNETISKYAIKSKKPFLVSDYQSDEKVRELRSSKEGLRSQVSLPITLKGKIVGTLNVGSRDPYMISEEQIGILLPIAQQIGAAIDRVRLFNQVSEDSVYIHNLLDSIDSIVYTVDRENHIREVNKAWYKFLDENRIKILDDYHGKFLYDILPTESLKQMYKRITEPLFDGSCQFYSEELLYHTAKGNKTYQLTINPMVIDKKVTGLVFTQTDITAIKNTEAELKKSYDQLLALNEISTMVSSSRDIGSIMESAVPLLKKIIEPNAIIVYLWEEGQDDLILKHQIGIGEKDSLSILKLKQSASLTGEVIEAKKSFYIPEKVYLDERISNENRDLLKRLNIEAMAVAPIISKGKVFGALDLFYSTPHKFSVQEQQLLTLVGNQFGAAIENTRLYSELSSQIERLTVLYNLSQQLTSTLNLDQIFRLVYEHVNKVVRFQSFIIDLYDESMKTKTPVFHVEVLNGDEVFVPKISHSVLISVGSPQANVISTKHAYRSADGKLICIPMLSKESLIGIMTVEAEGSQIYTDNQLKLLESVGNLSAIALEKGKLYEETLLKSQEIEQRNKELDDFTYVVSHDLKEPLISVEGFSRILQSDYQDIIQTEGREYLDSIVGATSRMKSLIDDLLLMSRVSRPSESFRNVPIKNVIDEIRIDMEFTIRQKGVNFIVSEEMPVVFGNETQIKIIFRNLIGNAVKFNNKPNPMVEITFQNSENNYYLFTVKDNGIGIDKDFHEKIFVIFQRLHRREEYEGTGAGLAIVKKIIELHKGKIWVESEPGQGSAFHFTLPKPLSQES